MTNQSFISRHRWNLAAALAVLLIYTVVLSIMPKGVFWHPDEGARFLQSSSLGWDGGLTYHVPYGGQRLDPDFEFFFRRYTFPVPSDAPAESPGVGLPFPIWFPLASRPLLAAFGVAGPYLLALLSGCLIAILSGRLAASFDLRLAPFAILLVGLGTPVFFYSLTFWEHTLATLIALVSVWILIRAQPGRLRTLMFIAPPLVLSIMLRIEMAAFAAANIIAWGVTGLVAYWRPAQQSEPKPPPPVQRHRRIRRVVPHLLLVGASAALLFLFDAWLSDRHTHYLAVLPERILATLHSLPHVPQGVVELFVNTPHALGPSLEQVWTVMAAVAVGLCFLAPFVPAAKVEAAVIIPALVVVLGLSGMLVFSNEGYRSMHGIFPIAPFMVVSPYALQFAWSGRQYGLFTLVSLALLYLAIGSAAIFAYYVRGGSLVTGPEWGPRYLLTLYPIMAILSLVTLLTYWQSARPEWLKWIVTVLVVTMMVVAVWLQVRGILMQYATRQVLTGWERALQSEGPIITDIWWLPTAVAPLFTRHEIFFVKQRQQVADWVGIATEHSVDSFTFASLRSVTDDQFGTAALRRVPERSRTVRGLHLTRFELVSDTSSPLPP